MHRVVRDKLEDLEGSPDAKRHLEECRECREEVDALSEQTALLRSLRPAAEFEPRPGFYARVMERIEAQGAGSIWNLFFDSTFGRRIAFASMALAVLLAVYLVTSERTTDQPMIASGDTAPYIVDDAPSDALPAAMLTGSSQMGGLADAPDQDSVLVNLVTYREQ
jgi:hypothetical protein